jgi:hypothetical protein
MPTIDDLIRSAENAYTRAASDRQAKQNALVALKSAVDSGDSTVTAEQVNAAIAARDTARAAEDTARKDLEDLKADQARDAEFDRLSREITPTNVKRPAYNDVARIGAEERTYRPDTDPRGEQFLRDVGKAFVMRDFAASDRLMQHLREERVERAEYLERATTTGNFDGLTVPQYLTDMFGKHAKAGRPFANAIRQHALPSTGMNVYIGKGTTGTDTGIQANQGDAATEQNYDDTLLTIPVRTNAGQQTMSRQAVERTTGALDVTLEDLFRAYGTKIDNSLITTASVGLSAVSTAVAYTDASPTVEEFWPKIQEGLSGIETSLLDQVMSDSFIAVMHPRRWRWMNQALTTKFPLIQQPGLDSRSGGLNYGEVYGNGFRGLLPDGTPVIVDANIATNLGAGTNEDEVYLVSRDECHLWEDPDAPLFIRAEETKAATVQILFVIYGYFAFTFERMAHARKIAGTGLITPTFTGV